MSSIKLITSKLIDECFHHIGESDTIYLLISFVMESGVRLLVPYLRDAAMNGADIKVLTGDYLFVTQPEALALLYQIHPEIEIRLWNSRGVSFHPKAYLFHKVSGNNVVIVGSSNLSKSALTTGVEWNLSVSTTDREVAFDMAVNQFLRMFYSEQTLPINPESIRNYQLEYSEYHLHHQDMVRTWMETEALSTMFEVDGQFGETYFEESSSVYTLAVAPRPVQLEALQQLDITKEEGYDKALVVMATGLGKTFLAAMFAKGYQRVLFVAHREEILHQARRAFQAVSPDKSNGLFTGRQKDFNVDIMFASILTLGQKRHRTSFARQHFDLIIVDEFHHASAAIYRAVIDWFQPEFLLGITATPDRADGREVYALCDGNVAYRIDFLEAIERKWLAPFHYIGVYDDIDYSQIRWLGTKYDKEQLLAVQTRESMAHNVLEAWKQHAQTRGIAFCSSVIQAEFLAKYFRDHGIRAICLHGGSTPAVRAGTITRLTDGKMDVIFTVDLFNEGVDIPAVDTLLFVRPTESLTVFTQQIGRGLRLHPNKTHCTIIDLIGNYRNADLKLSLFHIPEAIDKLSPLQPLSSLALVPTGCSLQLDLLVIDLLKVMREKRRPRKDRLRDVYLSLKLDLGYRPSYKVMHLLGSVDSREFKQEFGGYVAFLAAIGELDAFELDAYHLYEAWLHEVESTVMSKSYKMVLLLAMLEKGEWDWYKPTSPSEIAIFFHGYYMEKQYRQRVDFNDRKTAGLVEYDELKVARLISEMPMSKWAGSSNGIARFDGNVFWFDLDVREGTTANLLRWTLELCLYRLHVYFELKGQRAAR